MKEATGELNMTVITVVAIVAVGALFTFFVWPTVKANLAINTACSTIDSKGYSSIQEAPKGGDGENEDSYVICKDFTCTAYMNDGNGSFKTIDGKCKKSS